MRPLKRAAGCFFRGQHRPGCAGGLGPAARSNPLLYLSLTAERTTSLGSAPDGPSHAGPPRADAASSGGFHCRLYMPPAGGLFLVDGHFRAGIWKAERMGKLPQAALPAQRPTRLPGPRNPSRPGQRRAQQPVPSDPARLAAVRCGCLSVPMA